MLFNRHISGVYNWHAASNSHTRSTSRRLFLDWHKAVLRYWSIRRAYGELHAIKRSKYQLQFCRFWLVWGTWQNILSSRQNVLKINWLVRTPWRLIKHIWGRGEGRRRRERSYLAQTKGDMLCILVLTCFVLLSLFESDDRRFALLSPIKFIASANWM